MLSLNRAWQRASMTLVACSASSRFSGFTAPLSRPPPLNDTKWQRDSGFARQRGCLIHRH
jgi:hypothetical protein